MKLLRLGAALALMVLGACTTAQTDSAKSAYLVAVKGALTTYADVFQPAVLAYGHLPDCPQAAICKDQPILDKMKAADLAVSSTLEKARPVLDGSMSDGGQLAQALLAVQQAETTIANSGALKLSR